jgi:hypothetical protein
MARMYAAWSRVRRSKQPAAYARKVLLNRHLLERPSPDGPSRHTSRVIAAGNARWSHPQVRISGRGGQLPGTYQGRRGPRPVRRTVNGPGALSVRPGAGGWRDEQHPPKPEYEPFADRCGKRSRRRWPTTPGIRSRRGGCRRARRGRRDAGQGSGVLAVCPFDPSLIGRVAKGRRGVAAVEPERGGIDRSCSASTPMARLRTAAMTCGAGLPAGGEAGGGVDDRGQGYRGGATCGPDRFG